MELAVDLKYRHVGNMSWFNKNKLYTPVYDDLYEELVLRDDDGTPWESGSLVDEDWKAYGISSEPIVPQFIAIWYNSHEGLNLGGKLNSFARDYRNRDDLKLWANNLPREGKLENYTDLAIAQLEIARMELSGFIVDDNPKYVVKVGNCYYKKVTTEGILFNSTKKYNTRLFDDYELALDMATKLGGAVEEV